MISAFRRLAKSKFTFLLLGIPLILSLMIFGNVQDAFTGVANANAVVSAGSHTVTPEEFKREFDAYREQAGQGAGQPLTVEQAAAQGLDRQLLAGLADDMAYAELLKRAWIVPSDKQVVEEIRKVQAFFDPVTGRFDERTYRERLLQIGAQPQRFERQLRDQLASNHFAAAAAYGMKAPRIMSAALVGFQLERRVFSAFIVDPNNVAQPPAPTDEQLAAFRQENAQLFTRPEFRTLTVVRFSSAALEPGMRVDPDELQKRYEFRKDTLATAETRSIVQVPAKDAETAAAVAERLKAGEDPAAVAKSLGVDPVTYDDAPRTAVVDPVVGEAAFAVPAVGEVSAPIQGRLGYSVVKVLKINPGREVALNEAREQLEKEVRADAAQAQVFAQVEKYEAAYTGGASLTEAAQQSEADPQTVGPVSSNGVGSDGRPVPGVTQRLLREAFNLTEGAESDIVEESQGEYFAVRVDKVTAPALPPVAEIRDSLAAAWRAREIQRVIEARVQQLAERVRNGEPIGAVAASAGARLIAGERMDRSEAQRSNLPQAILEAIFTSKPGEVFAVEGLVGRIDSIQTPPPAQYGVLINSQQAGLGVELARDLIGQARASAKTRVKVRTNPTLARRQVGIDVASDQVP